VEKLLKTLQMAADMIEFLKYIVYLHVKGRFAWVMAHQK